MKALICEMCGSKEIIKTDGHFVCEMCGTKYSVEEAKKMMIEGTVDVSGSTVKVDNSAFVEKYLANARRAKGKEDWEEVEKYYNLVEQNDPNNIEAIFYSAYGKAKSSLASDDIYKRQSVFKVLKNCISILDDKYDVERAEENKEAIISIARDLGLMICSEFVFTQWKDGYGNVTKTNKNETIALFSQLLDAFRETIYNIQKIDDQPYMHEAAINLYSIAKQTAYWKVDLMDGWLSEERKRLKDCASKIVAKESEKLSAEQVLESAFKNIDNSEYGLAYGYFAEYTKRDAGTAIGYLGKALSMLALDEFRASADEVCIAAEHSLGGNNGTYINKLVNAKVSDLSRTLLINAAAFAKYKAVKLLVEAGSDVNAKSNKNTSALWHVASRKFPNANDQSEARLCAKLLLDKDADPNVVSSENVATFNKATDAEIAAMIQAKQPGIQKGKSAGCYVATAVYGSYDCPQVWTLRRYRDNTLAETWYGRAFIRTYYAISPTLVKWFGDTEWFKKMWKGKLDRMVADLQADGVESTPYEDKNW